MMAVAARTHSPRDRLVALAGGRKVGIAEYGDPAGIPVIGLHGAPASRLMYEPADATCRQLGLRLIAPDRPGIGLTPLDTAPHTVASVSADVAALADALALERLGLIGISGGAPYAVAAAALLGRRVQALALVSPVGPLADAPRDLALSAGHRWFFLSLPRHPRLLRLGARIAASAFARSPERFARLFAALIGQPDRKTLANPALGAVVVAMTAEALRQGIDGAIADLAIYGQPWRIAPSGVRARTRLYQGTADIIVPPAAAFHLAGLIPDCEVRRIEGGGHFWVLQHIDEVMAALAADLGAVR